MDNRGLIKKRRGGGAFAQKHEAGSKGDLYWDIKEENKDKKKPPGDSRVG